MPPTAATKFCLDPAEEKLWGNDFARLLPANPAAARNLEQLRTMYLRCKTCMESGSYAPDVEPINPQVSFNGPFILNCRQSGLPRLCFKPLPPVDAARAEFASILANLLGVITPLCLRAQIRTGGFPAGGGIVSIFMERTSDARVFSYEAASRATLEYLVRTRWLNELIGNLECWWGQFLVLKKTPDENVLVMIDLDAAFCKVSPAFLQTALLTHFRRKEIQLRDCVWLDREYSLDAPLGWAGNHYDSQYSFYGPLWRAYVRGEIDLDFEKILGDLAAALDCGEPALSWAMSGFLSASNYYHKGDWVWLPAAAHPRVEADAFRSKFLTRCGRALDEFGDFLNALKNARANACSDLNRFYKNLPDRPY